MRFIESLSWRTCYLVTGLRMSWCALAYWADCTRAVWVLDMVFHRYDKQPDHCRRSYDHWISPRSFD